MPQRFRIRIAKAYADFFEKAKNKRYVVMRGGTRAGKTYAVMQYLIKEGALERNLRISIVSKHFPHLSRGALRDFEGLAKELDGIIVDYHKVNHVFRLFNGSIIEFFSVDQSAKVRGAQRDILFINEANLIDFDSFFELDIRTRRQVIMDFNPTGKFWLNEFYDMHSHKSSFIWGKFTYKHNPFLSKEQRRAITALKFDERRWRVYGLGEWGEAAGQAWYNFEVVDELPPDAWLEAVGVDFGFTQSPTAVVSVWRLGDDVYVREEVYRYNMRLDELAVVLAGFRAARRIVGDAAQADVIATLRSKFSIPIIPCRKINIKDSFALLNAQKIKIVPPSGNLLKEAYNVAWEGDRLLAAADHAIDALRYALQTKRE